MGCVVITKEIENLKVNFPNETIESIKGLVGLWWKDNPKEGNRYPTAEELLDFMYDIRGIENIHEYNKELIESIQAVGTSTGEHTVTYTPKGKDRQTYTIKGSKIYNKDGKEVYEKEGVDRYRIFANLALKQGRAVIVEYNGEEYVVNNKGQIISVATGKLMKWDENNGDRKAIVRLSRDKFIASLNEAAQAQTQTSSQVQTEVPAPVRREEKNKPTYNNESFDTVVGATPEERDNVDMAFDPQMRRDRVTLLSRQFSSELDNLLENRAKEINNMMSTQDLSDDMMAALSKELYALESRRTAIAFYTPLGIFNRVRDSIYKDYVDKTEEERIQHELVLINKAKGADKYSDEKKLEAAKKRAAYKYQEYQKLLKFFNPLIEEASGQLLITEGLRVDPNYAGTEDAKLSNDSEDGSEIENPNSLEAREESGKDGWMTNFRFVSSHESLSQAVRKFIREMPRLNYKGMYDKDDLGNIRYLDADYVHATLIDKCKDMITSDDMMPLLEDLARQKSWVKQIINKLKKDDVLFSQFYQDFRKDFVQYWIQKKKLNPDGTFKIETVSINKPEGIYYLLDQWRDNYEGGILLDDDSVYSSTGEVLRDKGSIGYTLVQQLNNDLQKLSVKERLQFIEKEENWNKLIKLLHMVGIDPNVDTLKFAINNIKEIEGVETIDPIMSIVTTLNVIFKGIARGDVKNEIDEDGSVKRGDLLNTFGGAYSTIAKEIAEVTEDAIESSVRENDKTYYSHVNPSYMGKIIKQLKNVLGDEKKFNEFIEKEFKQYDWFYDKKTGEWRNTWLKELVENPEARKSLQHKMVLNYDKKPYTDWDSIDYTTVLLSEFFSEPGEGMAWYYVPILSDAPSAEFIRFKRITTGSKFNKEKKAMTFQEIITDHFIDIINQEYDRIQLVKERFAKYQAGDKNIEPIANFDMVAKKDEKTGKITIIPGGSEFKFLPQLNTLKFENGETFIQRFERLRNGSPSEFKTFLQETVSTIMEQGFEAEYEHWVNMGLMDETNDGKLKNIPSSIFSGGQVKREQTLLSALREAKAILGKSFTKDMQTLLNKYTKSEDGKLVAVDEVFKDKVLKEINELLNDKFNNKQIEFSTISRIQKAFKSKNTNKDKLREYYWNSKLATAQIIQLTTTDLAFYKDLEDFQKRYKEVHAPSLRLNTKATFHGKLVGRTYERTIYLKDDEVISFSLKDIEEVLDAKIAKDELTKTEKDYILSQFRKVNVADAQAYRSLGSYRAMMAMMGQWTDDMEEAYENFKAGKWSLKNFNTIWQVKKPYLYTQINKDSGIEGRSGIKTSVQHKNSEFLLLALYEAIAGPLGKSEKLKAINQFMEDNNIDVVQFESATKVGRV